MSDWRDSYDAWKLASPYDEGGPSYDSVEDLKRDYEALLDENDALKAALKEVLTGTFADPVAYAEWCAEAYRALGIPDPNAPVEEEIAF